LSDNGESKSKKSYLCDKEMQKMTGRIKSTTNEFKPTLVEKHIKLGNMKNSSSNLLDFMI
jgi:hypothetical protein